MSGGIGRSSKTMGGPLVRKSLIKRRRRAKDDEGEEEGSVAAGVEEDSQSEASALSDADQDADADVSDGSDADSPITKDFESAPVANGHQAQAAVPVQPAVPSSTKAFPAPGRDTETMMDGLKISEEAEGEEVKFEDLNVAPTAPSSQPEPSVADRARKEHEEYKKRRDADPAFVPNRGMFFMHDHRSAAPGQNGFRPFGRGRGRGRGNGVFPRFG